MQGIIFHYKQTPSILTVVVVFILCFAGCQSKSNVDAKNERIESENILPQVLNKGNDLLQNQANMNSLKEKLLTADSVSIISHKPLEKYKKYEGIYSFPLLDKGKPNDKIIQEKKILTTDNINELSEILSKVPGEVAKIATCFTPHHAIFISKDNFTSYINICFTCQRIETSENISFRNSDFDDNKWELLKMFFKNSGIKKFYQ